MIKFRINKDNGATVLGFGISEGNVKRLKEGQPIYFHLDELGIEGHDVLIMYGETEEAIKDELAKQNLLPKKGEL